MTQFTWKWGKLDLTLRYKILNHLLFILLISRDIILILIIPVISNRNPGHLSPAQLPSEWPRCPLWWMASITSVTGSRSSASNSCLLSCYTDSSLVFNFTALMHGFFFTSIFFFITGNFLYYVFHISLTFCNGLKTAEVERPFLLSLLSSS